MTREDFGQHAVQTIEVNTSYRKQATPSFPLIKLHSRLCQPRKRTEGKRGQRGAEREEILYAGLDVAKPIQELFSAGLNLY